MNLRGKSAKKRSPSFLACGTRKLGPTGNRKLGHELALGRSGPSDWRGRMARGTRSRCHRSSQSSSNRRVSTDAGLSPCEEGSPRRSGRGLCSTPRTRSLRKPRGCRRNPAFLERCRRSWSSSQLNAQNTFKKCRSERMKCLDHPESFYLTEPTTEHTMRNVLAFLLRMQQRKIVPPPETVRIPGDLQKIATKSPKIKIKIRS